MNALDQITRCARAQQSLSTPFRAAEPKPRLLVEVLRAAFAIAAAVGWAALVLLWGEEVAGVFR